MDIDELFKKYQEEDNKGLIEYIKGIVEDKSQKGQWDKGIDGKSDNLTTMLLYEYSIAIEQLTKGKVTSRQVIDKLSTQMGKLRFGDFKKNIDDEVNYDNKSVTSDDYKKECRIDNHVGAHAPTYVDKNGKMKTAIALFDDKQEFNGTRLSGIDLNDLSDIRGTIFHEWTHVMEKQIVRASDIKKEDIIHKNGDSTYINAMVNINWSMQEFEDYISNIDSIMESNQEITFGGISTIEINKRKNPNKRIMHNQISEGATEFIARKVMEVVGDKVKHPDRYEEQVEIIGRIFESKGLEKAISLYLTEPHKVINFLEEKKDLLHYLSEYINDTSFLGKLRKKIAPIKIDKNGNIEPSKFDKIKKIFLPKSKSLPTADNSTNINKQDKKDEFLKRLKVNQNEQNTQTIGDEHIKINDMISYGYAGNCVHLHMPIDLHEMIATKGISKTIGTVNLYLIDAIDKIAEMKNSGKKELKDKSSIYMISPILFFKELKLLENLGFETKIYKKTELSNEDFIRNDKEAQLAKKIFGINQNVGTAKITFEKLSTKKYKEAKEALIEGYKQKGIKMDMNIHEQER